MAYYHDIITRKSWEELTKLGKKYKLENTLEVFLEILNERNEALELNLNRHGYKKLKTQILHHLNPD